MYAASVGHVDILLRLIDGGAKISVKNEVTKSMKIEIKQQHSVFTLFQHFFLFINVDISQIIHCLEVSNQALKCSSFKWKINLRILVFWKYNCTIKCDLNWFNFIYQNGFTALMWAAFVGNIDTLQALIDAGADVKQKDVVSTAQYVLHV